MVNACSRDDDGDEQAHLLRKKKSSQENRTMVMSLCGCVCCLVTMVGIFVFALLNLTYPHPVSHDRCTSLSLSSLDGTTEWFQT